MLVRRLNKCTQSERLGLLVKLAEAVAQPRENEELASRGMLNVDEKHRNSLTALIDVRFQCFWFVLKMVMVFF